MKDLLLNLMFDEKLLVIGECDLAYYIAVT